MSWKDVKNKAQKDWLKNSADDIVDIANSKKPSGKGSGDTLGGKVGTNPVSKIDSKGHAVGGNGSANGKSVDELYDEINLIGSIFSGDFDATGHDSYSDDDYSRTRLSAMYAGIKNDPVKYNRRLNDLDSMINKDLLELEGKDDEVSLDRAYNLIRYGNILGPEKHNQTYNQFYKLLDNSRRKGHLPAKYNNIYAQGRRVSNKLPFRLYNDDELVKSGDYELPRISQFTDKEVNRTINSFFNARDSFQFNLANAEKHGIPFNFEKGTQKLRANAHNIITLTDNIKMNHGIVPKELMELREYAEDIIENEATFKQSDGGQIAFDKELENLRFKDFGLGIKELYPKYDLNSGNKAILQPSEDKLQSKPIAEFTSEEIAKFVSSGLVDLETLKKKNEKVYNYVSKVYDNYMKRGDNSGMVNYNLFTGKMSESAENAIRSYSKGIANTGAYVYNLFAKDENIKKWIEEGNEYVEPERFKRMNNVAKGTAGLIGGSANLIPTIGFSYINPHLGLAMLGTSVWGNSYGEAKKEGASDSQAFAYASLSAFSEIAIEKFAGGIPGLGEGATTRYTNKLVNSLDSSAMRKLMRVGLEASGEGMEEVYSYLLEPVFKKITYDPDSDIEYSAKEAGYNFLGGFVGSAIFGGANVVFGGDVDYSAEQFRKADKALSDYKRIAFNEGINSKNAKKAFKIAQSAVLETSYYNTETNTYTVPEDYKKLLSYGEEIAKNPDSDLAHTAMKEMPGGYGRVVKNDTLYEILHNKSLTKTDLQGLKSLADNMSVNVRFVHNLKSDGTYGENASKATSANAYIENKNILINADAKDPFASIALHSAVDVLKNVNPDKFQTFAKDFTLMVLSNGKNFSTLLSSFIDKEFDGIEEFTSYVLPLMLTDEKLAQNVIKALPDHRTDSRRIYDNVVGFVDKLRNVLSDKTGFENDYTYALHKIDYLRENFIFNFANALSLNDINPEIVIPENDFVDLEDKAENIDLSKEIPDFENQAVNFNAETSDTDIQKENAEAKSENKQKSGNDYNIELTENRASRFEYDEDFKFLKSRMLEIDDPDARLEFYKAMLRKELMNSVIASYAYDHKIGPFTTKKYYRDYQSKGKDYADKRWKESHPNADPSILDAKIEYPSDAEFITAVDAHERKLGRFADDEYYENYLKHGKLFADNQFFKKHKEDFPLPDNIVIVRSKDFPPWHRKRFLDRDFYDPNSSKAYTWATPAFNEEIAEAKSESATPEELIADKYINNKSSGSESTVYDDDIYHRHEASSELIQQYTDNAKKRFGISDEKDFETIDFSKAETDKRKNINFKNLDTPVEPKFKDRNNNYVNYCDNVVFRVEQEDGDYVLGIGRILDFAQNGNVVIAVDAGFGFDDTVTVEPVNVNFVSHNDSNTIHADHKTANVMYDKALKAYHDYLRTGNLEKLKKFTYAQARAFVFDSANKVNLLANMLDEIADFAPDRQPVQSFQGFPNDEGDGFSYDNMSYQDLLLNFYDAVNNNILAREICGIYHAHGAEDFDIEGIVSSLHDVDYKTTINHDAKDNVIVNGNYYFNDVYRNFERVFGKHFDAVKPLLDEFDRAKGTMARNLMNNVSFLQEICDKYNFEPGDDFDLAVQIFGEGRFTFKPSSSKFMEIAERFNIDVSDYKENGHLPEIVTVEMGYNDAVKIFGEERANEIYSCINEFRGMYEYYIISLNHVIEKIYPGQKDRLIKPRKDYFRHFREIHDGLKGFLDLAQKDFEIDPALSGVSERTKPHKSWSSIEQKRETELTDISAIRGFIDYMQIAEYTINIDPFIKQFRELHNFLKSKKSELGQTDLNAFLNYLDKFTNHLAKKTIGLDRNLTDKFGSEGRLTLKLLSKLNDFASKNAVLLNLSVAIKQSLNLKNGLIYLQNPYLLLKSSLDIAFMFRDKKVKAEIQSLLEKSDYLAERFLNVTDFAYHKSGARKVAEKLTSIGDEYAVKSIWLGAYYDAQRLNVPDPVRYADDIARKCSAGRGIGEKPLIFTEQVSKMALSFLLENNNNWNVYRDNFRNTVKSEGGEHIFSDQNSYLYHKNNKSKKQRFVSTSFKTALYLVATAGLGDLIEWLTGYQAEFNPLNDVHEGFSDAYDDHGPGLEFLLFGLLNSGDNLINDFVDHRNLAWAYRFIPFLGNDKKKSNPFNSVPVFRSVVDTIIKLSRKDFMGAGIDFSTAFLMPFGGAQAKKTFYGLADVFQEGHYKTPVTEILSGKPKGGLTYPVDLNFSNLIRGASFGRGALPEAKKYYEEKDAERRVKGNEADISEKKFNEFYKDFKSDKKNTSLIRLHDDSGSDACLPYSELSKSVTYEKDGKTYTVELNDKDYKAYQDMQNDLMKELFYEKINSGDFSGLSTEEKVKILSSTKTKAQNIIENRIINDNKFGAQIAEFKKNNKNSELIKLYEESGNIKVLPFADIESKFELSSDGEDFEVQISDSDKEIYSENFKKSYNSRVSELMKGSSWDKMTDVEKVKKLSDIYDAENTKIKNLVEKNYRNSEVISNFINDNPDSEFVKLYKKSLDMDILPIANISKDYDFEIAGENISGSMTDEEYNLYSEKAQKLLDEKSTKLINSARWGSLSYEEKVQRLSEMQETVNREISSEFKEKIEFRKYVDDYITENGEDEIIRLYRASGNNADYFPHDKVKVKREYSFNGNQIEFELTPEQEQKYNNISDEMLKGEFKRLTTVEGWDNLSDDDKLIKLQKAKKDITQKVSGYIKYDYIYKDAIEAYDAKHGPDNPIRKVYDYSHDPTVYPFWDLYDTVEFTYNRQKYSYTLSHEQNSYRDQVEYDVWQSFINEKIEFDYQKNFIEGPYLKGKDMQTQYILLTNHKKDVMTKRRKELRNYCKVKMGLPRKSLERT